MQQKSDLIITARQGISVGTVLLLSGLTGAAALIVYWLTTYPTISWWNSGSLVVAANCLGVEAPPGAVIPTILGWLVIKLPIGLSAVRSLNYFAGIIAALLVVFVGHAAMYILTGEKLGSVRLRRGSGPVVLSAIMLAALGFAWGQTLWKYASIYTEYVFTPLMTAIIVWAMLRWWNDAEEAGADRWLFVTTLLFGLDVSIHRTNLLLLPGLLVWLFLRHPAVFKSARSWLAGWAGLILGFAFHLLIIPMAGLNPYINFGNPNNFTRFWDYVSLKQMGGGFLVNLLPRNSNIWSDQTMDWVNGFAANFATHGTFYVGVGLVSLALGILGLVVLLKRNPRLGIGMLVLFLLSSVGAIIYFNIPANYFRSLWRHYLPSMVIFAILMAYGAGSLMAWVTRLKRPWSDVAGIVVVVLLMLIPVNQLYRNYHKLDNSANYTAVDYGVNLLIGLPERAVLFTQGDNDTFPLWYLQQVADIRRDVTVLNLALLNTGWYVDQMKTYDPSLPITYDSDSLRHLTAWPDTTIVIPRGDAGLRYAAVLDTTSIPDSITLDVRPSANHGFLMPQDRVLIDMIVHNDWYRPIFFTTSVNIGGMSYLQPHLRSEGLVWQFLPLDNPPVDRALMTRNLLEKYRFRGLNDPSVPLSRTDLSNMPQYYSVFLNLIQADLSMGDTASAMTLCTRMNEALPVERLDPPEPMRQAITMLCSPPPADTTETSPADSTAVN